MRAEPGLIAEKQTGNALQTPSLHRLWAFHPLFTMSRKHQLPSAKFLAKQAATGQKAARRTKTVRAKFARTVLPF
ncbi:hypothetical protein LJR030_005499 [Rhizobium sp. LjRoot30]|uniref:hypothetical protein n=1 Tax=Rhizobium sp. LjRoot30 TaxID=3342320 RepID=UPI003ECCD26A